ncbi:MAG: LPS-assembly protein LptD, partial [Pseudomonadota bacterium]|nr:LPS-assembly protein LptD [Pseudomonadota bacterium]
MRGMLRALTLAAGLALAAPVGAQDAPPAATLIADQIRVDGLSRLVADGHVEIFYDGYRVQAGSITYDQDTDQLLIEGEIRLTSPSGTVLTAAAAELSADLTNGILRSARLVLDQQLQLAAAQIDRIDGRYSVLSKTVASSCRVCAGQVPLWRIRAERIIHDEDAQQLFFDHARFEVAGV